MRLKDLLAAMALIMSPTLLCAQMNIDDVNTRSQAISFKNNIKNTSFESEYFSEARERARRAAIRRERNYLEISAGVQGSLTQLNDAWIATSGGDNTIAILSNFDLKHIYTYEDFRVESKVNAKFGYNRVRVEFTNEDGSTYMEPLWFKYQDEFIASVAPSIKISDRWSYGATAIFRTQFALGYVSRTQQEDIHLKSGFMAPGYLNISGDMNWISPYAEWPFKVSLSPLAMSAIYVDMAAVRENATYQYKDHVDGNYKYVNPYGVAPDKSSKYEGGSSINISIERPIDKKKIVTYKSSLFSFYGWITNLATENRYSNFQEYKTAVDTWDKQGVKPSLAIHPTLRWDNTIKINASRALATTIDFRLYYNRAQSLELQTQTLLSVGLIYTFKNK